MHNFSTASVPLKWRLKLYRTDGYGHPEMPSQIRGPQGSCEEHWVYLSQSSAVRLFILQQECHVIMSFAVCRISMSNTLNIVYYIKLSTGTWWLSTPPLRTESPFHSLLKNNVVKDLFWLKKTKRTELNPQIIGQGEESRMKWCFNLRRCKTIVMLQK